MICSLISGWMKERDSRNKEENKTNYITTVLKAKSYSSDVSKEDIVIVVCILFSSIHNTYRMTLLWNN
jgi:hypothetical protein